MDSFRIVNAQIINVVELEKRIYDKKLIDKKENLLRLIKSSVKEFKRTNQEYKVINI